MLSQNQPEASVSTAIMSAPKHPGGSQLKQFFFHFSQIGIQ